MAFDGIVISNVVHDLNQTLIDGRIYKIYQPEKDELNLMIKNNRESYRLLLSADASLPLIYLTNETKGNPLAAPNFCMLLRKHIGNGRIVDIRQPGFERIVEFTIEHLDEMGDLCRKKLIIEIMGKHSNIIFTEEDGRIIDSIKHISHMVSSVREVLPGKSYVYPPSGGKCSPFEADETYFTDVIWKKSAAVGKAIYTSVTGISPLVAEELCYRAEIDGRLPAAEVPAEQKKKLYAEFEHMVQTIQKGEYVPNIIYDGYVPVEFSSIPLTMYSDLHSELRSDISAVLDEYYFQKSRVTRIRQKSANLRKIVQTAVERTGKKYDLQLKQMQDTENREIYRIYGELINTYGYDVAPGSDRMTALNYYTGEEIEIPLDPLISVSENAKRYFTKYNKQKRTWEALTQLTVESKQELDYLRSVQTFLDMTIEESALAQVREELVMSGYIKARRGGKSDKHAEKSKPYHYVSSDGFHMYVGKNNLQNEELTFKFANGGDMWFHAKKMPGSHVIVRMEGAKELPDTTYEEAARLAAYYSSGREAPKVEIDYTKRMNLKKPAGAKPGFVIYHTNYSMVVSPDLRGITCVTE